MTVTEVAAQLGKSRPQVSRLLSSTNADARGHVPEDWQALLDLLGYEVTIRRKW